MKMELKSARFGLRACALGAALSLIAGAAMAQNEKSTENDPPRAKDLPQADAAPKAAVVVNAPNARLAGLIQAGGTLIRQKNIAKVTRPKRGIYCILPASGSGVAPANSVVTLTTEYFYSNLNEVKAQWASKGGYAKDLCAGNTIVVYTLADPSATGLYSFSNDVGFSIYVP
jgi:hypothetical protein